MSTLNMFWALSIIIVFYQIKFHDDNEYLRLGIWYFVEKLSENEKK